MILNKVKVVDSLFKSLLCLWIFCVIFLSIIDRGILKSLTIIVDLPILLEVLLVFVRFMHTRIVIPSWRIYPFIIYIAFLFITEIYLTLKSIRCFWMCWFLSHVLSVMKYIISGRKLPSPWDFLYFFLFSFLVACFKNFSCNFKS